MKSYKEQFGRGHPIFATLAHEECDIERRRMAARSVAVFRLVGI